MESSGNRPGELLHLDALRVVASLGIVAYHFSADVTGYALKTHLQAFVDLFFVVSGAVLCHVYGAAMATAGDYWRFMAKRMARLLPLHWITLSAFVVIGAAAMLTGAHFNNPETYEWSGLLPNALLLQGLGLAKTPTFNVPSWSVSAEMGCYLLFPAFLFAGRRRALGLAVVAAFLLALAVSSGRPWYLRTADGGAWRAMPAFLLGIWLYSRPGLLSRVSNPGAWLWVALAAFGVSNAVESGYPALFLVYLIAGLAIAADRAGRTPGPIIRALAPCGALTYSVYLLHWLVQVTALDFLGRRVLHLSGPLLAVEAAALVPVTVVLAMLSLRFIEHPARRAMTGLLLTPLRPTFRRLKPT